MSRKMGFGARWAKGAFCAVACSLLFLSSWSEAAVTTNRLASNKLASNRLASNKLASNKLASNKLASNKLASNGLAQDPLPATRLEADPASAEMLSTPDGREVFSYLVECALPEALTIEAVVPGAADTAPPETLYACESEVCTFQGSIGLAQHWAERRLDPKGQRWVSACMLARVNAYEISETISLRGAAPELAVGLDEARSFGVQEGAFFGNLFTDSDGPIDWNACRGSDQASAEFGGLSLRDCTEPDPADPTHTLCGFNFAGDCADFSNLFPAPYACGSFDAVDGAYGECHPGDGNGHWPGLKTYREIITTYVAGE